MKDFKKKNNQFVCEECEKTLSSLQCLSTHIKIHGNKKKYYDKWLKSKKDGICVICDKETKFTNKLNIGYEHCCSKECTSKYKYIQSQKGTLEKNGVINNFQSNSSKKKMKQTMINKYGVEHALQKEEFKNKSKQTLIKRYGIKNGFQSKKIEETNMKKYGVKRPFQSMDFQLKIKNIIKNKYGVENIFQNDDIKNKCKQSMVFNHNVEYAQQDYRIHKKQQISSYKLKQYKNTEIYYRGSYELDFLEKYYNKYPDIQNGPTIKYYLNEKQHYYHPDFYIPSLNLIVEIKNSYLNKIDKEKIKAKEKATVTNGFKYCLIVDKDYTTII